MDRVTSCAAFSTPPGSPGGPPALVLALVALAGVVGLTTVGAVQAAARGDDGSVFAVQVGSSSEPGAAALHDDASFRDRGQGSPSSQAPAPAAPRQGPREQTLQLSVTAAANTEVTWGGEAQALAICLNTTEATAVYIVEENATSTTNGRGPYCKTGCVGGATFTVLGRGWLRGAGAATVQCGFYERLESAQLGFANVGGAGGLSETEADAFYLRLDGTNDGNVTADIDLPIGFSVDGSTFTVNETTNRVGIGAGAAPENLFDIFQDSNSGSQMYIRNPNAGNVAAAAAYLVVEAPPYSGGRYAAYRLQGAGFAADQNQLPLQLTFFSQSGITNGMMFRTDAANAPIVFGVSTSDSTGHQLAAEKLRIGSTAVTFNKENSDVDFIVDSDAEDAAFSVDGQTTANLTLNSGDSITATTAQVTMTGDLDVNGGDINSSAATFNITGTTNVSLNAGADLSLDAGGGTINTTSVDMTVDVTSAFALTSGSATVTSTNGVVITGGTSTLSILDASSFSEDNASDQTFSFTNAGAGLMNVSVKGHVLPNAADVRTLGTLALQWARGFFNDGTVAAPSVAVGVDDAGLSYNTASDFVALSNVGDVYITGGSATSADFVVEVGGDITLDAGGLSGGGDSDVTIGANGATGNVSISTNSGGDTTITTDALHLDASYARMPRFISTAPVKPTCNSTVGGAIIYVDDTDDGNRGLHCSCSADSAGAYTWLGTDNLTACPGT